MRLLTMLLASVLTAPAAAATLKPFTTLSGSVVRLSDLWDGLEADKALGPAPAPGGRITVPAPQLAAIARQFGVDWHSSSASDRAVLERPGRTLTREDIRPAILAALARAGAAPDAELELAAFSAAPVPTEAKLDVNVQQFDLDQVSGRFTALLAINAEDAVVTELRLTGRIQEMVDLPVARHRIMPGDVVTAGDLEWSRMRVGIARGDVIHALADAVGLAAKRSIPQSQPIAAADLGKPIIVQKGDSMMLTLDSPGIALTARGTATEPGGVGDRIRVLNDLARVTVDAEIVGRGQARILPGSVRPTNRFVAVR